MTYIVSIALIVVCIGVLTITGLKAASDADDKEMKR